MTATMTSAPFVIPTEPRPGIADLDEYDSAIAALDLALRDADAARRDLEAARRELELIEARHVAAGIDGRNEAERKARLLLALLDDPAYRNADDRARDACEAQRDAERRVRVLMERCRLLRAAVALAAP
jgi:hypothetical protein